MGLVLSFYFAYCQENKGLKYGLLFVLKNIQPTFVSTMKYTSIKAKIFAPMLQMPVFSIRYCSVDREKLSMNYFFWVLVLECKLTTTQLNRRILFKQLPFTCSAL